MFCRRAVCGFLEKDGKVLVVTRRHSDKWGLIGGKVDPGETEEEALRRELLEEANLVVDKFFPIFTDVCGPGSDGKAYVTTTYFLYGDVNIDNIKQMEEGIVPLWIDIDKLATLDDENVFQAYNAAAVKAYMTMLNQMEFLKLN